MIDRTPSTINRLQTWVFIFSAWNLARLIAARVNWDTLLEFSPRPGPLYLLITAAFWTLAGLALWAVSRRRHPRSQLFFILYASGYAGWYWIDRLLFQEPRPNWPFALALTIILLLLTAYDIFNQKTTNYFRPRETHEQTPSDRNPA